MALEPNLDDRAPWKQRFRAPIIWWSQIARANPSRGLVISNTSGVEQLHVWDVPTGSLRQLTDSPKGVQGGFLAPDGRFVYYLDDQDGNEIGHIVRVPYEGGAPRDMTPDVPVYSLVGGTIDSSGARLVLTLANAEGFHVSCVDLGPEDAFGALRQLYHSTSYTGTPITSHGGELAVVNIVQQARTLQSGLLALDTGTGRPVATLSDEDASIQPIMFSPLAGNMHLLATTNRSGVETLLIWDVLSGERIDLMPEELQGAVRVCDWSPDGTRILLHTFNQATQQLYLYHLADGTVTRLAQPTGTFTTSYFGTGNEIFTHWQNSTHPLQLIALDAATGAKTRTVLAAGNVPPGHRWQSVTFTSSDGTPVQGWLGHPEEADPFPTIVELHGGPETVVPESFSPASQAWINHGFAYLTINYRGSTTFGREFQTQIWGNPGQWEIEDLIAARSWLIQQGVARPNQIVLTGWSYGGYLTLLALGKQPDLWAGGMAGTAIADGVIQYEDSAGRVKGYIVALMGGTPEERTAQYAASSPITYVEHVTAPVLIIQGRNDTQVPARQIERYEAEMRSRGKAIEVHWFDAGHLGSAIQVELSIAHMELMLRFAYQLVNRTRNPHIPDAEL